MFTHYILSRVYIFRNKLNSLFSDDRTDLVGRENSNSFDLNRNFPDQYSHNEDNGNVQPETRAVMKWLNEHPFVLSANLHGGSLVANYPFDNSKSGHSVYSKCPDDRIFKQLAKSYSYVSIAILL